MTARPWPQSLWIVRHGESAGNVARDAALAAGQTTVDIQCRDVDVKLSPRGELQARAAGRWFGALPLDARPTVVMTSPFVRARTTSEILCTEAHLGPPAVPIYADERLREKEFGVLDGLTKLGIETHMPEQAEFRRLLGKFYHRPPGGESWCDVILRLRSVIDTLRSDYDGARVLLVAHTVIVLCMRYVLEGLTEAEILSVDREADVANASITQYACEQGALVLRRYNFVAPLEDQGVAVTGAPDMPGSSAAKR